MPDSNEIPKPSTPLGILGCVGGLFIHLVIGSLYQWGIISIYITSYYHYSDHSVTLESTAIAFPLMMFCIGATMRLGLYLSQIISPLAISIIGQIVSAVVILISSFMPNIWLFILFYGIIFGLCVGLNFMVPIYECNKYLVGKKMYVNGLILIGTGCGPVVFGEFSYNFLNPTKIAPVAGYYFGSMELQEIAFRVPTLLKWLALLYVVVGLLGTLMLVPVYLHNWRVQKRQKQEKQDKEKEEQSKKQNINIQGNIENNQNKEQKQRNNEKNQGKIQLPNLEDGMNPNNQLSSQSIMEPQKTITQTNQISKKSLTKKLEPISPQKKSPQLPNLPIAESMFIAMKSGVFWLTIVLLFICACGSYILNGNYKTYVKNTIHDDSYLTVIGVIGSVGNGCTRFFWSLYYSKTGFKTAWLTIMLFQIIIFSTIRFTTSIQGAYTLEIFLSNCCIGGYLVATPTALTYIYGERTGSNIYGIYWCNFALSNFLGYIYVNNLTKIIGFDNVIYICLGMTVIVIPFIIFSTFKGPWENSTHMVEFCVGRELAKIEIQKQQNQSPTKALQNQPSINSLPFEEAKQK